MQHHHAVWQHIATHGAEAAPQFAQSDLRSSTLDRCGPGLSARDRCGEATGLLSNGSSLDAAPDSNPGVAACDRLFCDMLWTGRRYAELAMSTVHPRHVAWRLMRKAKGHQAVWCQIGSSCTVGPLARCLQVTVGCRFPLRATICTRVRCSHTHALLGLLVYGSQRATGLQQSA